MIITGYQGIGKNTFTENDYKIIDLESSSFWNENNKERFRHNDWYVYYCQVAEHLSKQGYIVFISCHPVVREYLSKHTTEKFCAIFPSLDLKTEWIKRLEDRYDSTKSNKDLKALEHAKEFYDNDIYELYYECFKWYSNSIKIDNINYDLKELVEQLQQM